jgi:hypothetical protein
MLTSLEKQIFKEKEQSKREKLLKEYEKILSYLYKYVRENY